LRSAIDQAYWEAISPNVEENKQKAIQFPLSKDAATYEQTIRSRQGEKAGNPFFEAVKELKAYHGAGGNIHIVLLHEINIVDKHKYPTPTGNFSKLSSLDIQKQIPDFPNGIVNCGFGRNKKDVAWRSSRYNPDDVGTIVPPFMYLYHKQLRAPVETWFYVNFPEYRGEVVDTMEQLIGETERALETMKNGLMRNA
jgi:hypothetical protein